MSSLIDGVFKYSRIGRDETPTSIFELGDIVNEVKEQLQPMNEKVEFEIINAFPKVENKQLYKYQLVSNLVSNAIRYNDFPEIKI
jgi:light-regulated signal transduction histidine kinase (bacteriophytochrome)